MRKLLLLFVLLTLNTPSFTQTKIEKLNRIRINFGEKEMSNLKLVATLEGNLKQSFPGHTRNGLLWEFVYPDSLYEHIKYFDINDKNDKDSSAIIIAFAAVTKGDTLRCGSCHFSRGNVSVNSSFFKKVTYTNVLFKNIQGKIGSRNENQYQFLIGGEADRELLASIEGASCGYSFFNQKELSYEESLKKYSSLTVKYPESYGLVAALSARLNYYQSKKDVASVFNLFSAKIKESYFGKELTRNLKMDRFENMMLLPWNSDRPEPILLDLNKFSLVVYSASWCGPCHKQIPLIRDLHDKLGEKLNVIYVSIDDENTIENWRKMMKEGEIPGRSLLALGRMEEVRKKYFVRAIPYSFLVHPGGMMEVVNVGIAEDRNKLYRLVGN